MPVQPLPQFGRIFVAAAHTANGTERYSIRLSDDDCKLAPYPELGDRFILHVRKDGVMQAEYRLRHRTIGGVKRNVKPEAIIPLLNRMVENTSWQNWQTLLETRPNRSELMTTFPAITFESRHHVKDYEDFATALRSTRDKLGLHDTPPPEKLHQRVGRLLHRALEGIQKPPPPTK